MLKKTENAATLLKIADLKKQLELTVLHNETKLKIQHLITYFESEHVTGPSLFPKKSQHELAEISLSFITQVLAANIARQSVMNTIAEQKNNVNPIMQLNPTSIELRLTMLELTLLDAVGKYRQLSRASYIPGSSMDPMIFIGAALMWVGGSMMAEGLSMMIYSAMSVTFPPLIALCLGTAALCFSAAMAWCAFTSYKPSGLSLLMADVADSLLAEIKHAQLLEDIQGMDCKPGLKPRIEALILHSNSLTLIESVEVLKDVKQILHVSNAQKHAACEDKYKPKTSWFFTPEPPSKLDKLMGSLIEEKAASANASCSL